MSHFFQSMFRVQRGEESFSQCGEDRIIRFVFDVLKIDCPTYLDIGAHHPYKYSNTYLFYRQGSRGVLIEPNSKWLPLIRKYRPRDVCLNVGLGKSELKGVPFYEMQSDTLNTFSKEEADRMVKDCGQRIINVNYIDIVSPNSVIGEHIGSQLNFVSIDVEGYELNILSAFDFGSCRPDVLCIETLTYSNIGEGKKVHGISNYLEDNGYFLYADTFINSIYVEREKWRSVGN